jgi:hypothetical protein
MSGERARSLEDHLQATPFLADFYAPLPPLVRDDNEDLDAGIARLAQLIGGVDSPLAVRFVIADADDVRTWLVEADPDGCRVSAAGGRHPAVEVMLDADTWRQVAAGRMSMLEAFGRGRMRVRGEIGVARDFAQALRRAGSASS